MSTSTLIEVFGHILYRFTRGVTEHYNPDEPEFTAEFFGYSPLESTGREWYCHPVDELIYQEYSDREPTSLDYLPSLYSFGVKVTDACSTEQDEETQEAHQNEDKSMAWKRLRPSVLHTVFKSMYNGAWISLLMAIIVGTISTMVFYLSFETVHHCDFNPLNSTSVQMQWMGSMSNILASAFIYVWFFILVLFLFRPFQLTGIKRKLFLFCYYIFFGHNLSCFPPSCWFSSFLYFQSFENSAEGFLSQQSVSASLCFNKVPLPTFTKENGFILLVS